MKSIFKKILLFLIVIKTGQSVSANIPLHAKLITVADLNKIFPQSTYEISTWTDQVITATEKQYNALLKIPAKQRTFENTIRTYDALTHKLTSSINLFMLMANVHHHNSVREKSTYAASLINGLHLKLSHNEDIYKAFMDYKNNQGASEKITDEERYFLTSSLTTFKQQGLHLPATTIKQLKNYKTTIANLANPSVNTTNTEKTYWFTPQELQGIAESLLKNAPYKNNRYALTLKPQDFSNATLYVSIMETCDIESTRKTVYEACQHHQVSPADQHLTNYLKQQNEYAQLLGYPNHAALDLENTMAKTPENVTLFLQKMIAACVKKGKQELDIFKKNLPKNISLNAQGTIDPWNYHYVRHLYKSNHLKEEPIDAYLPIQIVLDGIFTTFETFFKVTFTPIKTAWIWHHDVIVIAIQDKKTTTPLGYLYLDLFKRDERKPFMSDCYSSIISAPEPNIGTIGIINTQFTTNNASYKCITHANLITLFHECGHALHAFLARTRMAHHHSMLAKTDYLEMPSQMLERWCFEPSILKSIGGHYKTGKQLSSDIIEQLLQTKNFDGWQETLSLCLRSLFCIKVFEGIQNNKKPYHVWQELQNQYVPLTCLHIPWFWYYQIHDFLYDPLYSAKFYSYPWSQVLACDIFETIKRMGLTSTSTGQKVKNILLEPGAGTEPTKLLHNFLDRQPRNNAFLNAMGIA